MHIRINIALSKSAARTLKGQAAFEGLTISDLAENMIRHCLTDDQLLKCLIAECQAAKAQAKQAA